MSAALIGLAIEVGAPLVRKILEKKIGAANADLATGVAKEIAKRAGVTPEALEAAAASDPDKVKAAIQDVEADVAPEMLEVYDREVDARVEMMRLEQDEPAWVRAWRPLGVYATLFLWLWNAIILHVANAIWKIALPPMDWQVLLGWSGLYLSLYMGGHTVKAVAETWRGRR